MSEEGYPTCYRCDLCDFQTRKTDTFKKHVTSQEHLEMVAKNDSLLGLDLFELIFFHS